MTDTPTILITGAAGNLGAKLRRHWQGRYPLRSWTAIRTARKELSRPT